MPFPIYEKKEDIPKGFEDFYEAKDGKFAPKVPDPAKLTEDVTKLTGALEKQRGETEAEHKARVEAENKLAEETRKKKAGEAGITEQQLKDLQAEDEKKRKPIEEENKRLKAELEKVKKTDRVQALALKSGIMQDRIEDAMLILDKRTGLAEGGEAITVLDAAGKLTTTKIEDFLSTDFKKEKPWLYAGPGASGSGAEGSQGGGGGGGEYDPVAAGKAAAAQQKKGREENKLAFT